MRAAFALLAVALACTLLWVGAVSAQALPVGVGLSVEPDSVTVGDSFTITLSASHSPEYHVMFPRVPADWGEFEIRNQRPLPTVDNGDGTLTSATEIEAVLFKPGTHATPSLSVSVRRPDGTVIYRPARPMDVTVVSVLTPDDTERRDIRPQADIPVPAVWPWAAGGAATLGLLAVAGGYLLRRRFMGDTAIPPQPQVPPAEAALAELDRIEALNLPARGRFGEHYVLVSTCLRQYIRGRFGIPALDLTTRQVKDMLATRRSRGVDLRGFGHVLDESDLVKFARFLPGQDEAMAVIQQSRDLILRVRAGSTRFASYFGERGEAPR